MSTTNIMDREIIKRRQYLRLIAVRHATLLPWNECKILEHGGEVKRGFACSGNKRQRRRAGMHSSERITAQSDHARFLIKLLFEFEAFSLIFY